VSELQGTVGAAPSHAPGSIDTAGGGTQAQFAQQLQLAMQQSTGAMLSQLNDDGTGDDDPSAGDDMFSQLASSLGATGGQPGMGAAAGENPDGAIAGASPNGMPGAGPNGMPGASPYGMSGASPYGVAGASPYGAPGASPYGVPGAGPYGVAQVAPGATGAAGPFGAGGLIPVGIPGTYAGGAGAVPWPSAPPIGMPGMAGAAGATSFPMVSGDTDGLSPDLLGRLNQVGRQLGTKVRIESGFRSRAEQARLYQMYLNGTGNLAAPPGHSNHESGKAADVYIGGTALANHAQGARIARQLGLGWPVGGEPWHTEIVH
jgi:hypothetical protein